MLKSAKNLRFFTNFSLEFWQKCRSARECSAGGRPNRNSVPFAGPAPSAAIGCRCLSRHAEIRDQWPFSGDQTTPTFWLFWREFAPKNIPNWTENLSFIGDNSLKKFTCKIRT